MNKSVSIPDNNICHTHHDLKLSESDADLKEKIHLELKLAIHFFKEKIKNWILSQDDAICQWIWIYWEKFSDIWDKQNIKNVRKILKILIWSSKKHKAWK